MWAGIAGFLKATVGAHEVITTIMLNWIAIWVGQFLFGLGGPLQNAEQPVDPDLERRRRRRQAPGVLGRPAASRASRSASSSPSAALVVYWLILNRTTLGYGVRAVGFNPEAARYGGISVSRNYFLAMAISGTFAGLAGALDILGWQFRLATTTSSRPRSASSASRSRCSGATPPSASALVGAAVRRPVNGTSTRNLDPTSSSRSSPAT